MQAHHGHRQTEYPGEAEQRDAEHQAGRARVARVCVDMGWWPAVRCPFPCSFVATSRETMVAHMRRRHLEQPVFPLSRRQRAKQEKQCPACGWVVEAGRFRAHFQSLKCRVYAQERWPNAYFGVEASYHGGYGLRHGSLRGSWKRDCASRGFGQEA